MDPEAGRQRPETEPAVGRARARFLDDRNVYGCAETAFVVLKEAWGLESADDPGPAMALNGGVAYSGGTCGAITGAALAVGIRSAARAGDHAAAKRIARRLMASTMAAFRAEHGALDCRALTGFDLAAPGGHEAFIASGIWREGCMRQIAFVVERLAPLGDPAAWAEAVAELDSTD